MKKTIIGLIGVAILITGIKVLADNGWVKLSSQEDWMIITTNTNYQLKGIRFHDDEKAVTCWVTTPGGGTSNSSGISCLPDKELK